MKEILQQICSLQPSYTSENTPAMQERGRLIRGELVAKASAVLPTLKDALGPYFDDIGVEGSDGIGRKTEAPWVRIFSRRMSPNPREGFYIVFHFALDGRTVFLTVGCGSTTWKNGDLTPISDIELKRKTSWARKIVADTLGGIEPFSDTIALGARAALPRTFEKATALAKAFPSDRLDDEEIVSALLAAAKYLCAIYRAQDSGTHLSFGDVVTIEVAALVKTLGSNRRGQGFGLSAAERRAVEIRAMAVAADWLRENGHYTIDTSATEPFDFIATKEGHEVRVEVKGTTSDDCSSIVMTHREVDLHRRLKGSTALILVYGIRLDRSTSPPLATDGDIQIHWGWDIDSWELQPIAFQVFRPTDR